MKVKCPGCKTPLNIPDHLVGKPAKCKCGKVFKCSAQPKQPAVNQSVKTPVANNSFRVVCPNCSKTLNVPENRRGQKFNCPCGQALQTKATLEKQANPATPSNNEDNLFGDLDLSSVATFQPARPAKQNQSQAIGGSSSEEALLQSYLENSSHQEANKLRSQETLTGGDQGCVLVSINNLSINREDGNVGGTVSVTNLTGARLNDFFIKIEFIANNMEVGEFVEDAGMIDAGSSRHWPLDCYFSRWLKSGVPFSEWHVVCSSAGEGLNVRLGDVTLNKSSCFVVTAAAGDSDAPLVNRYRVYRDRYLLPRQSGKILIFAYYQIGPWAAAIIRRSTALQRIAFQLLSKFADVLKI